MGDKSKIEWTDASWTPIRARNTATGKIGWHCERATPGCAGCYAESMNLRLGTGLPFKPGHRKDIEIFLDEKMLLQPLGWKKPRMIFVCSMTDLFADFVPDEWIDQVFAVMALAPQHTFQVLTKRAERMRTYFDDTDHRAMAIGAALGNMLDGDWIWGEGKRYRDQIEGMISLAHGMAPDDQAFANEDFLPLPNVWLGVSAEDQTRADERIPHLLETPAAVRFVSAEPLLGPIDFSRSAAAMPKMSRKAWISARLDWIIVGGESGPNARPMHPDWARSIRDQCEAAGVPFFFKQWGEHVTGYLDGEDFHVDEDTHGPNVHWRGIAQCNDIPDDSGHYGRVGKRAAGRLLDGREHNEMPERDNG